VDSATLLSQVIVSTDDGMVKNSVVVEVRFWRVCYGIDECGAWEAVRFMIEPTFYRVFMSRSFTLDESKVFKGLSGLLHGLCTVSWTTNTRRLSCMNTQGILPGIKVLLLQPLNPDSLLDNSISTSTIGP